MSRSKVSYAKRFAGVSFVVFKHAESHVWWLRLRRQLARTNFLKNIAKQIAGEGERGFFYPHEQRAYAQELERIRAIIRDGYVGR